jgi:hypothetical protein
MRRIILLATVALLMTAMLAVLAGTAAAHPHEVKNPNHDQQIANGQNHPGYVHDSETGLSSSCESENDPNSDPAFYGLESAHHGPDAGDPGKGDGCYAAEGEPPPPDTNPAID